MKGKKIIFVFVAIIIAAISIILIQTFKAKRENKVYVLVGQGLCFVADQNYQIETVKGGFDYFAGQNKGEMRVLNQMGLNSDLEASKVNGITYGYKKEKNYRTYEYVLNENQILRDYFLYKKRAPIHLVPYRDECKKMMGLYPVIELHWEAES